MMTGNLVESAPNPIELQEFQFKLFSRLRVVPEDSSLSLHSNLSLVCSASRYGLLFVGCPTGFHVLQTSKIVELQDSQGKSRNELVEFPRREISLPSQPVYLGVSCDHQFLAVVFSTGSSYNVKLYYVPSFYSQSVRVLQEVRATSDLNTHITGFCWNPGVPNLLALCLSDGSVHVYEFKETTFVLNSTPPEARATCLCWSPKGKQIVLGSVDGTLTQYKPELKAVKQLPAPVINQHAVSVVSVHWLSNYQFAAVYRDAVDPNERPALMIVNAPKNGPQTFINYEDICYSTGNLRPPQYYLEHLQQWKVLVVGTSNSIEVGVLGCMNRASDEWQLWVQDDSSRADLPLSKSHQETFPVGLAIDTSIEYCLPCGENQKYPPMPVLCLYSHDGLLCIYFIVNSLENAEQICAPPTLPADLSGLSLFTNMVSKQNVPVGPELNQGDFSSTTPVAQVVPFGTTHQLAAEAPVSGISQAPITSVGGLQPSFFTETSTVQSSWMTPTTSLQKVENKGKENSGIENITPPHGGIQQTPVSGTGGMSLFSGIGLSFQKTLQQPQQLQQQQLPLQSQTPQQLQQTPQKQQVPLSFAFNPVSPSGPPPSSFGRNTGNVNIIAPVFGKGLSIATPVGNVQNLGDMSSVSVSAPLNQSVQIEQPPVSVVVTPENTNRSPIQPSSPAIQQSVTQEGVATESTQESMLMREEVVNAAIVEEVAHFDAELQELFNSFRNIDTKIGENSEKVNISTKLESLESFCNEVTEATNGLKNEVDVLKNTMLETFCYVEDAKARDYQCKNPGYKKLVYSQELDPVIKRKLNNINHYTFYINNQIKEASRVIDDRWILYQDKRKAVKGRLRVPPREELFQALVIQNNIINKHKFMLENIQQRIRQRNQRLQNSIPLITNLGTKKKSLYNKGDTELSKLAENLLQVKLNEREYSKLNSSVERPSNKAFPAVAKENLLVTEEKKNILRQIHSEIITSVPKIRVPQPFTVSKQSGVFPYTSTPKGSAANSDSMSLGEKLLQKYLKSELCKVKSDSSGSRILTESTVVKDSNSLKTQSNSPASVSVKSVLVQQNTERSSEFSPDLNQQKDTLVKWNQQKDTKSTFNSTTELVKPVVIQPSANLLTSKNETIKVSTGNKENFSLTGTGSSLSKSTDKSNVSDNSMEKYVNAPAFKMPDKPVTQISVTPALGGSSLVEEHQKTPSPLVSIDKIVSSIGEKPDTIISSQTNSPSFFSNLGHQQKSLPGLFSTANQSLQTKVLNQEQQKPQTIFGDAFNKSQAITKQNVEESKSSASVFSSPSLFKGGSSPQSSSSSNSSSTTTLSFGVQESSQNKPSSGSIFSGKQTQSPLNVEFSKSSPSVSPNISQDQLQKNKDAKSENVTTSSSKESTLDQTIHVSKPGSIFGGMGASASTTPGTFSFGLGKSLFGGNSATSSAGQSGFTFSSSWTTPPTVGNATNPGDQVQFSFSPAASNVSSGTSFGTLFSSAASTTGNDSSVTTVATAVQSSSSFSFTKAFAVSSGQPPNLSSDVSSSQGNDNLKMSAVSSPAGTVSTSVITTFSSTSVSTTVSSIPISAMATPVSISNDPGSTVTSMPTSITVTGSTTPSSINISGMTMAGAPVSPVISSGDNVTSGVSDISSPGVSKIASGNSTVNTPVAGTPTTSASSTTSNPKASEATSVASPPSNTFSFGKLSVSSTESSTPTTASSAANFSFAQMLSTTSPDSGAKVNLAFGQQSSTLGTSLFGGTPNSAVSQSTNIFGQATPQTVVSTQSSTPFSFTLSPESSQQPSTTASFFGGKSLFGSTPAATTTTSTTSFFGQPVSTPASTTAPNMFGQSLASSSPSMFGAAQSPGFGTQTFGSKTTFGQSSGSIFGQSSSGGFGANSGSVFGGSSVFGGAAGSPDNPAQPGSLFQTPGSGGGLFGARANTGTSPGGSFSTGGQTISQTGFGPPAFQSKPGGFGSSPPSFGSAPSFGGAPTFGGSPTFGNPGKVFGGTSPTVGFGSGTQQSTTFENLANQNTMSFGNLAQNQQQPGGFPSGGSLFGGTAQGTPAPAPAFPPTTFGGNSFSTWR